MASCSKSEQTAFLLKLKIDGKEVVVSVTPDIVQALNSEDATVRHFAYEYVANQMKKDQQQLQPGRHYVTVWEWVKAGVFDGC